MPPRPVAIAGEAATAVRVVLQLEQDTGSHGRIGEVREQAVDAEPVELQVFVYRVAGVVGHQAPLLVAEGPGVDDQADLVRAFDPVFARQKFAARFARAGKTRRTRAHNVALPRA